MVDILDMLDWHELPEIQSKGRFLAQNVETIIPFIQPLTQRHNKNVWENCALIIAEKNDETLKPHLVDLLGWLKDMNWPGFFCILDRLKKYSDSKSIQSAISICIEQAEDCNDEIWKHNLYLLMQMHQ